MKKINNLDELLNAMEGLEYMYPSDGSMETIEDCRAKGFSWQKTWKTILAEEKEMKEEAEY